MIWLPSLHLQPTQHPYNTVPSNVRKSHHMGGKSTFSKPNSRRTPTGPLLYPCRYLIISRTPCNKLSAGNRWMEPMFPETLMGQIPQILTLQVSKQSLPYKIAVAAMVGGLQAEWRSCLTVEAQWKMVWS